MSTINGKTPTRQQLFKAWLLQNGLTLDDLAKRLGISAQRLSYALRQKSLRPDTHTRISSEIPAEYLPEKRMSRAQVLAENARLQAENAELKARLGEAC